MNDRYTPTLTRAGGQAAALKLLLAVTAIVTVPFGVASLLLPAEVGALYGSTTDANGLLWARYYGAAILAVGLIAWQACRWRSVEALRGVTQVLFILFILNLGVSLPAQFAGHVNALGWTTVVLEALLIIGFGIIRWQLRDEVPLS